MTPGKVCIHHHIGIQIQLSFASQSLPQWMTVNIAEWQDIHCIGWPRMSFVNIGTKPYKSLTATEVCIQIILESTSNFWLYLRFSTTALSLVIRPNQWHCWPMARFVCTIILESQFNFIMCLRWPPLVHCVHTRRRHWYPVQACFWFRPDSSGWVWVCQKPPPIHRNPWFWTILLDRGAPHSKNIPCPPHCS